MLSARALAVLPRTPASIRAPRQSHLLLPFLLALLILTALALLAPTFPTRLGFLWSARTDKAELQASHPTAAPLSRLPSEMPTSSADPVPTLCDAADQATLSSKTKSRGSDDRNRASTCETQRIYALTARPTPSPISSPGRTNSSWPTVVGAAWSDFVAVILTPLADPALAVASLAALLLLVARLLTVIPQFPWFAVRARSSWLFLVLGIGLDLLAAFNAVLLAASSRLNGAVGLQEVAGTALLGLAASLLVAIYLATRLSMQITVTADPAVDSPALALRIAAYINEIGAIRPDHWAIAVNVNPVTVQEIVVPSASASSIIDALTKLTRSLFAARTWVVTIAAHDSGYLDVSISRHGWHQGSAVINPARFPLPTLGESVEDRALTTRRYGLKLAASFILATVAPSYRDFAASCRGLAWQSVGLFLIATTEPAFSSSNRGMILREALRVDPGNYPAHIAWESEERVLSTSATDLLIYAESLQVQLRERELLFGRFRVPSVQEQQLRLRLLVLHADIGRNLRAASGPCPTASQRSGIDSAARSSLEAFALTKFPILATLRLQITQGITCTVLHPSDAIRVARIIRGRQIPWLRQHLAWEDLEARALEQVKLARTSGSTRIAYGLLTASNNDGISLSKDDEEELFERAFLDPKLKDWAKDDPELQWAKTRDWYMSAYPAEEVTNG